MTSMMFAYAKTDEQLGSAAQDALSDYRGRRAMEDYERAERKRLELAEQHSTLNDADARIRAWEKVHHLRMPSDPSHTVLYSIAAATQLTIAQVRQQQQLRVAQKRPTKV
jgi:hypothetical protein